MRILAGYDGTVPADGALYDLESAGLPEKAEALVLTASAPWVPPLLEAKDLAERGARYLRERFPGWEVRAEAVLDDPGHALLEKAEAWRADLIVLGMPDRSTLARFFRGSVTQRVLHHAGTGVRVCRPRLAGRHKSPTLLLAMDGSAGADAALAAVASRRWARGTEVRVTAVVDGGAASREISDRIELGLLPGQPERGHLRRQSLSWIERRVESACAKLYAAGLSAIPSILPGDPRRVLIAEARDWEARALFMGSRGLNPVERFVLGSVSSAVAGHAPCTVEVVHSRRMSARNRTDRPAPNRNSSRQR